VANTDVRGIVRAIAPHLSAGRGHESPGRGSRTGDDPRCGGHGRLGARGLPRPRHRRGRLPRPQPRPGPAGGRARRTDRPDRLGRPARADRSVSDRHLHPARRGGPEPVWDATFTAAMTAAMWRRRPRRRVRRSLGLPRRRSRTRTAARSTAQRCSSNRPSPSPRCSSRPRRWAPFEAGVQRRRDRSCGTGSLRPCTPPCGTPRPPPGTESRPRRWRSGCCTEWSSASRSSPPWPWDWCLPGPPRFWLNDDIPARTAGEVHDLPGLGARARRPRPRRRRFAGLSRCTRSLAGDGGWSAYAPLSGTTFTPPQPNSADRIGTACFLGLVAGTTPFLFTTDILVRRLPDRITSPDHPPRTRRDHHRLRARRLPHVVHRLLRRSPSPSSLFGLLHLLGRLLRRRTMGLGDVKLAFIVFAARRTLSTRGHRPGPSWR
jgi:hypothetical protein